MEMEQQNSNNKKFKYDVFLSYRYGDKKTQGETNESMGISTAWIFYYAFKEKGYTVYFDRVCSHNDSPEEYMDKCQLVLVLLASYSLSRLDKNGGFYKELKEADNLLRANPNNKDKDKTKVRVVNIDKSFNRDKSIDYGEFNWVNEMDFCGKQIDINIKEFDKEFDSRILHEIKDEMGILYSGTPLSELKRKEKSIKSIKENKEAIWKRDKEIAKKNKTIKILRWALALIFLLALFTSCLLCNKQKQVKETHISTFGSGTVYEYTKDSLLKRTNSCYTHMYVDSNAWKVLIDNSFWRESIKNGALCPVLFSENRPDEKTLGYLYKKDEEKNHSQIFELLIDSIDLAVYIIHPEKMSSNIQLPSIGGVIDTGTLKKCIANKNTRVFLSEGSGTKKAFIDLLGDTAFLKKATDFHTYNKDLFESIRKDSNMAIILENTTIENDSNYRSNDIQKYLTGKKITLYAYTIVSEPDDRTSDNSFNFINVNHDEFFKQLGWDGKTETENIKIYVNTDSANVTIYSGNICK
jgi:hypothetical protein